MRLRTVPPALILVAATACGKSGPVPTHPVRGSVFVGGQPAKGARVMLVPAGGTGTDYLPQGVVRDDGSFALTTFNPGDGAPAGEYAVRIEWRDAGRPPLGKKGPAQNKDKFGGRYSAEKSGFKVTVKPGENELPPYHLTAPK